MNIHYIQNKTGINVNMDYGHTGCQLIHGPQRATCMSVVFLIGWLKVDLLPLMHITDDLRT